MRTCSDFKCKCGYEVSTKCKLTEIIPFDVNNCNKTNIRLVVSWSVPPRTASFKFY